jgi:hypothetical protein
MMTGGRLGAVGLLDLLAGLEAGRFPDVVDRSLAEDG